MNMQIQTETVGTPSQRMTIHRNAMISNHDLGSVQMSAPGPLLARLMTLMVLMSMLNLTGCALTDSRQRLSDNSCTQGCQSSCLPETNGSSPPTVKMAAWERCVDPMPLDAVPAPVGTYVQAWQQAQSAAAGQNHWVIERNE